MSSSPHQSYQSQLFTFFARRSRQWADRLQQAFRYTKVTTAWGFQTVAYTVSGACQQMRQVGRQLQARLSLHKLLPALPHPAEIGPTVGDEKEQSPQLAQTDLDRAEQGILNPADRSIEQVLAMARTLDLALEEIAGSPETPPRPTETSQPPVPHLTVASPSTPLSQPPKRTDGWLRSMFSWLSADSRPRQSARLPVTVRAIASLVDTRHLVLVAADNQILDVLTAEQQQTLAQRISWEAAHYERYARIVDRVQQGGTLRSLVAGLKAWPLFQGARPLATWFKQKATAILTQRPGIPAVQPESQATESQATESQASDSQPIASQAIEPASSPWPRFLLRSRLLSPGQLDRQSLARFLGNRASLAQLLTHSQDRLQRIAAELLPWLSPNDCDRGLPPAGNAAHPVVDWETDPWLTADDLFRASQPPNPTFHSMVGDGTQTGLPQLSQSHHAASVLYLPGSTNISLIGNLANQLHQALGQLWERWVEPTATDLSPTSFDRTSFPLASSGTATSELVSSNEPAVGLNEPPGYSPQMEAASDWLETQAMPMGYVQHPLERLLRWVDRLMAWFEGQLTRFSQWLRSLWHHAASYFQGSKK